MTLLLLTVLLLLLALPAAEAQGEATKSQHPANHLARETSPYLLQHAHNPVDWYPWGEEALALAKQENKPIFLSVGYSACHWCHVMERESFENEEIAKLMNEWFVCVKVDREERPDVDAIYMDAVQAMTGSGGWPMSVFMTPDLEPFYGGTYFPPEGRGGRPGFKDVLKQVHAFWVRSPETAIAQGRKMIAQLSAQATGGAIGEAPGEQFLSHALAHCKQGADLSYGGFGREPHFAPKFPRCTQLLFLLRRGEQVQDEAALSHVRSTLDQMAKGGMYDQVGGGFARYSVDRTWTVPHFEKMLYDNSQLAVLYMEAWQAFGDPFYEHIAREVLDYVAREMTGDEGEFFSATDADSEGVEGKFFVWSLEELREVCGADADVAVLWFGASQAGNFEGHNNLTAHRSAADVAKQLGMRSAEVEAAVTRCKAALYARRAQRIPPLLDDKSLASWNGLMLSAFARAAAVFDDARYLELAQRNAAFLLGPMRREGGGLYRTRRGGHAHLDAYLEDYAFVSQGLLDLYEADLDPRWLASAQELTNYVDEHFSDERGGYYKTASYAEGLPVRMTSPQESSLPGDIAIALLNSARLGLLEGSPQRLAIARAGLARHSAGLMRWPSAHAALLALVDWLESDPAEVYVVGPLDDPRVRAELRELRTQWPPLRVFAHIDPANAERLAELLPAAEGKAMQGGKPTVYLCHQGVCEAPRTLE